MTRTGYMYVVFALSDHIPNMCTFSNQEQKNTCTILKVLIKFTSCKNATTMSKSHADLQTMGNTSEKHLQSFKKIRIHCKRSSVHKLNPECVYGQTDGRTDKPILIVSFG